jgi:hypothetical protein
MVQRGSTPERHSAVAGSNMASHRLAVGIIRRKGKLGKSDICHTSNIIHVKFQRYGFRSKQDLKGKTTVERHV